MVKKAPDAELRGKIAESIRVRGIASSILSMAMPTFDALNNLLEVEGFTLNRLKTNDNESDIKSIKNTPTGH